MSTRDQLAEAFKAIRKSGGVARMNFMCCSSCAWAELSTVLEKRGLDEDTATVVFWNQQADDAFVKESRGSRRWGYWTQPGNVGDLRHALYLQWQGDKDLIAKSLKDAGLAVSVPADDSRTFIIFSSVDEMARHFEEEATRLTQYSFELRTALEKEERKVKALERKLKKATAV